MNPKGCSEMGCFANDGGWCRILAKTDWEGKPCPFYEHKDNVDTGRIETEISEYEKIMLKKPK